MAGYRQQAKVWATILYPESMEKDWRDSLKEKGVGYVLSPLHARDLKDNPGHGEDYKKPHHHLMMFFGGNVSRNAMAEYLLATGGAGAEVVRNVRNYVRYLIHLDETDKDGKQDPHCALYDKSDIETYNVEIEKHFEPTADEKDGMLIELCEYVDAWQFTEYSELERRCRREHPEWYPVLLSYSNHIHRIVTSNRNAFRTAMTEAEIIEQRERLEKNGEAMAKIMAKMERVDVPTPFDSEDDELPMSVKA